MFEAYEPLDLLLENPSRPEWGLAATYDLRTGMVNSGAPDHQRRTVFLRPDSQDLNQPDDRRGQRARLGEFAPCGCCGDSFMFGQSSVQDHLTKGDQPFQALLATQIRVQPPGPQAASDFAPLRGRKVLIFSDSRQVAARLAPTLQSYSLRDAIRALLPVGYRLLAGDPQFAPSLVLDHAFIATLVAAHRYGVRLRPELETGEAMPTIDGVPSGQVPTGPELIRLLTTQCPANLMRAIARVLADTGLGLEPLAIASIAEAPRLTARIDALPDLPRLATDAESKRAVARAWLRCWHRQSGIWFGGMPPSWWTNEVRTHSGTFQAMDRVLTNREAKRAFTTAWLPRLVAMMTRRTDDGGTRLLAENLSLDIGGRWRRCPTCKSVHRPIASLATCIDCEAPGVRDFDPATDEVFRSRRGFYRDPIIRALETDEPGFLSLIAAEHTAQLNAAQPDDAFSQAENHELRFQDIDIAWRDTDPREPAIDVLSSTTTMEVGIDIGELSGVALRNMPPGRANYQQRAGRAGRRGNAVATVIAFGSSDSHDDHYFTSPDEMIRGPVTDPRLTLENPDIARRHVRAFLLQRYHEDEIPGMDPQADPSLFSVLGSVRDFRLGTGILNRNRFAAWLEENREDLEQSLARWLPHQLAPVDREALISNMARDVLAAVDDAIDYVGPEPDAGAAQEQDDAPEPDPEGGEDGAERPDDEEGDFVDPAADKLLDRLLYRGILPRYAFPTDVAPFYVFNRALTTVFTPKMEFAPAQGLNIALSQYAPNKQIWIKGKQYTSKAIYSPYRNERRNAWGRRKLYFECSRCGHAKTEDYAEERRNITIDCEACRSSSTFGPAKPWFRPPGFAHPIDQDPVTTPDAPNETAYATRAKLVMPTPSPESDWVRVGDRVRGFPTRRNLLVTNAGPEGEGYHYCVACGRIEAVTDPELNLRQPHDRPYRTDETELCPGRVSGNVVLGTDFITDIALFSLPLAAPFRARPGNDETAMALRTVCEALATAANRLLQIETGEILAEYRPALTESGAEGLEVEVFLYDTLAGGAGFAPQLVDRGAVLFERALAILESCPENCDASCYRCLRSFRNKLDHRLLDRKLGAQFLRHVLYGGYPAFSPDRVRSSLDLLCEDLSRQFSATHTFSRDVLRNLPNGRTVEVPILVSNRSTNRELWVALSSPLAPEVPVHDDLRGLADDANVLCIDDVLVRRNLPRAISLVRAQLP
ncbi:MAG: Zn-binding domain-containing protein [Hyphomicrobiaceae bacterium]